MPLILTTNATIMCDHGGQVMPILPRQGQVSVDGGFVLRLSDLVGATIVGCPQAGPGIKPCTTVMAPLPGSFAPTVLVGGEQVLLQTMIAATDGVPPATVAVTSAGQESVQAQL
jgi:hypothetical protein